MSDKKANGSDPLSTPDPGPEDILSKSQARRVEVQKAAEQGKISVPVKAVEPDPEVAAPAREAEAAAVVAEASDPLTVKYPDAAYDPAQEKKEGAWKRLRHWLAGQQGPSI